MIGLGRLYTVEFHGVAVSAQQDFFYIKPAADKICILEAVYLNNAAGTTDAGDAKEDFWRIEYVYLPATVTVGSGGNSFTPNPIAVNDAAAGFTARINDTTKATTSGTALNRHSDGMNSRVPYIYMPPPEHRNNFANAAALCVRLMTTPNASTTMNGTAYVRELP